MTTIRIWSIAAVVAVLIGAVPLLDEPSEPELAQQVADDTQQAITDAQVAAIGEQR